MIYSGAPHEMKTRKAHGVAICLDQTAAKVWKDSGSEWEPISERIVKIRLQCTPIHITVIAVYSPINPTTKEMANESDKFYSDLQDTINNVSTKDMIIIMGDLNARVGQKQQQHIAKSSVGPFTVDVENENGTRLTDSCEINNIIVSNTFFKHKLAHQTSWMHPRNKIWHMIDYTLVNKKFRSSVEDVRMFRRAAGAIGTDHHLMRVKIRMHLKSRRKNVNPKKMNVDSTKLKDDKLLEAFQKDLRDTIDATSDDTINIDERYQLFLSQLKEKAEQHFPVDKNSNRKRKEWLTTDILKIVDQKAQAFIEWQNNRGSKLEPKYQKKYERLRKTVKTMTEQRQVEYWDEVCEDIEKSIKNNDPATAFSIIRRLRGGSKRVENIPVQDKNGKLLVNSRDTLKRWGEFFCETLNVCALIDQNLIDQIQILTLSTTEEHRQNAQPSIEEVRKAINQMKSRKAPGSDEVTVDILKAGGESVIRWLFYFFTDVWKNEQMAKEWSITTLIRLYKNKGDKKVCDNYRGIALLNATSKIFSRIILNRIQGLIDGQLLEIQSGFRSNRSTTDQIFTLKMTMEKRREFNKPLFMCFIDIAKAYDSVNRELLWKVCLNYGISEKLVNLLKMLYKDSIAKVKVNGEASDTFEIKTGVMQGGIPSPILFNILFDFIIRRIIDEADVTGVKFSYGSNDFCHGRSEKHDDFDILALLYADDLVVVCETAIDLEKFIKSFEKVTQQFGLTMSIKKTCLMSLQQLKEDQHRKVLKGQNVNYTDIDINIRNQKIETAVSFTYLGCIITNDQRHDTELSARLTKASKAFNMLRHAIWHRKSVSITARLRIFRACILPVLLYGSETWALTMKQEQRIASFYNRCLRTIIGVNLGDRMSNETLLDITGQPTIENIIRRNRLRWFGHVNRAVNQDGCPSLTKKTMFGYFHGEKRPSNMGRSNRWENSVLKDIKELNIGNWRKMTLDRSRLRETINTSAQDAGRTSSRKVSQTI
ncbi:unnamed protein product [Rotaria magnacalcarata]|nr:unnamed protein product [Rotaria magnacalcarata]